MRPARDPAAVADQADQGKDLRAADVLVGERPQRRVVTVPMKDQRWRQGSAPTVWSGQFRARMQ
jgi:hypothetical protein